MLDLDTIHNRIVFCCDEIEALGDARRAGEIIRQLHAVNTPNFHGDVRGEYVRILQLAEYEYEIHEAYDGDGPVRHDF